MLYDESKMVLIKWMSSAIFFKLSSRKKTRSLSHDHSEIWLWARKILLFSALLSRGPRTPWRVRKSGENSHRVLLNPQHTLRNHPQRREGKLRARRNRKISPLTFEGKIHPKTLRESLARSCVSVQNHASGEKKDIFPWKRRNPCASD